jgi:DNA-binding response OmpR family regulator
MKILLVEDDRAMGAMLREIFARDRYLVDVATDGRAALDLARTIEYDSIVLDVSIPEVDGITVCRQLRSTGYQQPILLLTANDRSSDRVSGLDAGADDYVVKPFDPAELMARIRALLRRSKSRVGDLVEWENISIDPPNCTAMCEGKTIKLTPKEYALLELLILNPQRVFSRRSILDRLWGYTESPGEETVSTHIKCLRQKLKAAGAIDAVETVHGLGYRLRNLETVSNQQATAVTKVRQKTDAIFERFRDTFVQQWQALDLLSRSLATDTATIEMQATAKQEAHKLAGSLGMFGLHEGSRLAKEIERFLKLELTAIVDRRMEIARLVDALNRELQPAVTTGNRTMDLPLIYIIDDDPILSAQIASEAPKWSLKIEAITDLNLARQSISNVLPDAILLDLNFPDTNDNGLTVLGELMQKFPQIPVLVFTGEGELNKRLQVARLGGCTFLEKPLPTYEILQAIDRVLDRSQIAHTNRVMVVDDDRSVIEYLRALLQPFGIDTIGVENPATFWEVLTQTQPNLLILDWELPGFQGVELCQTVRSDPKLQNLGVLFLSSHCNEDNIDRAYTVGADGYISKSIAPPELVTKIIRRLRRAGFNARTSDRLLTA